MPLVTLRSYRDPVEAEVGHAHLELEGIGAVVVDDDLIAMQWNLSAAVGGVKLKVSAEDLTRADALLGEDRSVLLDEVSGSSSPWTESDRCPACGSQDLVHSSARRRWAALSLLLGLPLVFGRRRWLRWGYSGPRGVRSSPGRAPGRSPNARLEGE